MARGAPEQRDELPVRWLAEQELNHYSVAQEGALVCEALLPDLSQIAIACNERVGVREVRWVANECWPFSSGCCGVALSRRILHRTPNAMKWSAACALEAIR
jgi:hypothetical protein